MFIDVIEAAFKRTEKGLVFLPEDAEPETFSSRCQLRVTATDGDIASIEIRSWGSDFAADLRCRRELRERHWRPLGGSAFPAALSFLRNHGEAA